MAGLFSTPGVYRVTANWLTHGAWQKSKQNKERARKRKKAQGLMIKLPTLRQQLRGEGRNQFRIEWVDK
jgi:hypothetical protein